MARLLLNFESGKNVLAVTLLAVLLSMAPFAAHAGVASIEDATKEMVYGRDDAPLTIVEYASLGCPHCARFHETTFPQLKKDYIDTGKVRMIYRDFPLGTPALAASMIARCAGSARYFGMVNLFYRTQSRWSSAQNPMAELGKVARMGGMSTGDVEACFQSRPLQEFILNVAKQAKDKHGVNSTPSFVIGGKTVSGALEYDDFKKLLDQNL